MIPELLDKVDDETMGFTIGVELAYLSKKIKRIVLEAMENTLATPNLSQAIRIKKMQEEEKISVNSVEAINQVYGLCYTNKEINLGGIRNAEEY